MVKHISTSSFFFYTNNIKGGGYYMGGSADRRYNLSFIVENSVEIGQPFVAVSINYRLSAWGFLFSDQILGSGNTNLGLRDQRLGELR